MSTYDIDATDYNPDGYTLPSEGLYYAEVDSAEMGRSKAGDQMLTLRFTHVGGSTSLPIERLTFGERAKNLSISKLVELGCPLTNGKLSIDTTALIGKRVAMLLVHQMGTDKNGNERKEARVAAFGAVGAAKDQGLPGAEHVKFCGYLNEADAQRLGLVEGAPSGADVDPVPF